MRPRLSLNCYCCSAPFWTRETHLLPVLDLCVSTNILETKIEIFVRLEGGVSQSLLTRQATPLRNPATS
jgi:hypothetical protein